MNPRDPKDPKSGRSGVRPSPTENDWKLPDPTQRKRESKNVDISRMSKQTRDDNFSRIILIVALFIVCLFIVAGGAYITLHPDFFSSSPNGISGSRVAVEWAGDERAVNAFAREEANSLKLSSEQLGVFSRRYG